MACLLSQLCWTGVSFHCCDSPQSTVLRGDHQVLGVAGLSSLSSLSSLGGSNKGADALVGGDGGLVTALVHREALGDHQGPVDWRAQGLHLLDTAGGGQEPHLP